MRSIQYARKKGKANLSLWNWTGVPTFTGNQLYAVPIQLMKEILFSLQLLILKMKSTLLIILRLLLKLPSSKLKKNWAAKLRVL